MKILNWLFRGWCKEKCSYRDFLLLFPHCSEDVRKDLEERLRKQPRPTILCGKQVPENLNKLAYGVLDDLRSATTLSDPITEVVIVLLDVKPEALMDEDINDVFGFLHFVKREIEKINNIFLSLKRNYSKEEKAAGINELDFGSFGVLDWYAQRMGITNQNEVRDVAWVRIYQCMKIDQQQTEYERRLQKQYLGKQKG